jgi:hypothetical protein
MVGSLRANSAADADECERPVCRECGHYLERETLMMGSDTK